MLSLITAPDHKFVLQASTADVLMLQRALGRFSQRDFMRVGLDNSEIQILEKLHSDLGDLSKVLKASTEG